jgi:hypothetical protein
VDGRGGSVIPNLLLTLMLLAPIQDKAAPTLSEIQKLQIQNVAQRIELAQLRAQAAQREFEAARGDLSKLITTLKVEGYTLDLETLSYRKDAAKPAVK